jgi:hypothetical protein
MVDGRWSGCCQRPICTPRSNTRRARGVPKARASTENGHQSTHVHAVANKSGRQHTRELQPREYAIDGAVKIWVLGNRH